MFKKAIIASLLAGAAFATAAKAAPLSLPGGPLFVQFQNYEQILPAAPVGTENSWGILQVRQISTGTVITPNELIAGDTPIFNATAGGPQITGMFYSLNAVAGGCSGTIPICSTGGVLDLYWDEPGLVGGGTLPTFDGNVLLPGLRSGVGSYPQITDGTFLVRLLFASGADAANPAVTLVGTVGPSGAGFSGNAEGFFNVDTTVVGAWTNKLDADWFNTVFAPLSRDLRFRNTYTNFAPWNGLPGTPVFGAFSSDPVQAFAVPEPGVLGMIGMALLGFAFARRRKV